MSTEYFNNDKLGRVLEQLYRRGLNHIFMSVVLEAVKIYELETSIVHKDIDIKRYQKLTGELNRDG